MHRNTQSSGSLASAITRAASKQTYFTIRLFVDRGRAADAFRAYGYFRWVDDVIDAGAGLRPEKIAFADRQRSLLESCYRGEVPEDICAEEWMLVDLIRSDREKNSGLQMYLRNMMDVMVFDAGRRGRVISQAELTEYTRKLGIAVTEALHYFIGHDEPPPHHEARYLAVTAAHITHMLRDTMEDVRDGYFNIPREVLQMRGISPLDVNGAAYREWVCGRVELARGYFKAGRECIRQVRNLRCRLAGFAYTARFEWMLGAIERDRYCLRSAYPERKSIRAGLWMVCSAFSSIFASPRMKPVSTQMEPQLARIGKR